MKKLLILSALAASSLAGVAMAQDAPPPPPAPPPSAQGWGADANRDRVITRQEYLDQAARRFDRMDLNHDGKLDANELRAAREMRRMHGAGGGMRGGNGDMPPPPPGGNPDGQ